MMQKKGNNKGYSDRPNEQLGLPGWLWFSLASGLFHVEALVEQGASD